ncbi:MAG: hypothetical protein WBP93_07280 [Pyrinomonadaceae bacterium]
MKTERTKTVAITLALLALVVGLTPACKKKNATPTETFRAFYEAAKRKDPEGIKKTLSKSSLKLMEDEAKAQNKNVNELLVTSEAAPSTIPETRSEKIEGDTATLEVKNEKAGRWVTTQFVREDGEWKIAVDKMLGAQTEK